VTEPIDRDQPEFTAFVAASSARLLRTAWLLTLNREQAQDLVQLAYAKTFAVWRRVRRDDAESYARRVLVNSHIDWWRRAPWRERATAELPDQPSNDSATATAAIAERAALAAALRELTKRERTIVVLRYYLDVSEADVADQLRVSVGTVKSTASKALAKLRESQELADFRPLARAFALEEQR
jgi:RNA polymerase sigma-70 factor (sigma-E family)